MGFSHGSPHQQNRHCFFEEAARDARRHAAAMELGKLFTEHGRRGAVSALLTIAMFAPGRFFDDNR